MGKRLFLGREARREERIVGRKSNTSEGSIITQFVVKVKYRWKEGKLM
jgi:hypothetical protein